MPKRSGGSLLALLACLSLLGCDRELALEPAPAGGDSTDPGDVSDLLASPDGADGVQLAWTASGDDGQEGRAASYEVGWLATGRAEELTLRRFRELEPLVVEATAPEGGSEAVRVDGLASDVAHCFAVVAVDDAGRRSGLSNVVCAKTADAVAPAPPPGLVVLQDPLGRRLRLEWAAAADPDAAEVVLLRGSLEVPPPTGSALLPGESFSGAQVIAVSPAVGGGSALDAGLTDGQPYVYTAFVRDDDGLWSEAATAEGTPADATAPGPLTGFVVADGFERRISLAWSYPADDQVLQLLIVRAPDAPPVGAPEAGVAYDEGDALGDGVVIFAGPGGVHTDLVEALDAPHGYAAYAFDPALNYALPVTAVERSTSRAPPTVTFEAVAPNPAGAGAVLAVSFSADRPVTSCAASIGGQTATCAAPAGAACACSFPVGLSAPEGSITISVTAGNEFGTGTALGAVQIDRTPPSADPARVELVRRPIGEDDEVRAGAGAFADDSGDLYAGRGIARVELLLDRAGPVLLELAAGADGSLAAAPLTGTDGLAGPAPARLFVRAVDLAGNASGLFEAGVGGDLAGPTVEGALLAIARRPLGLADGVSGAAGALVDAQGAVLAARVYAPDGTLLGEVAADAAGGFAELGIGTPTSSFPTVLVAGVDKAGNEGPRIAAAVGNDDDPPVGRGELLVIVRHDLARTDEVLGLAGAFADAGSAARAVELYADQAAVALEAAGDLAADGGFGPLPIGSAVAAPARLWAVGIDKAGNRGSPLEVTAGASPAPPVLDGAGIELLRTPVGQLDQLTGNAAVLPVSGCAVVSVEAFAAASGGAAVASGPAGPAGFGPLPLGSVTASYPTVFVAAIDRCGGVGPRVEAGIGRDLAPPLVDGARVTLRSRPAGTADAVFAAAGAIADAGSGVAGLRLLDGASLLASPALAADGSFAEVAVGDRASDRVTVEATDKAGNVASVPSRAVDAVLSLAGRLPHDDASSPAALYAFAADLDPRLAAPGLGPTLVDEAPPADAGAASAIDGDRAVTAVGGDPSSGSAAWSTETSPLSRHGTSLAYDRARGVVVLYGGGLFNNPAGSSCAFGDWCADTWEYDGAWREVAPSSAPGPLYFAALAFDEANQRSVLFGGERPSSVFSDETWAYGATGWSQLSPAASPPSRRAHAMVYDPDRGVLVMFGGLGPSAQYLGDTWEFDGVTWRQLSPAASPAPRRQHRMVYDRVRHRTVLFGGDTVAGVSAEVWEWDGTSWLQGSSLGGPAPAQVPIVAFDEARGAVVVQGGSAAVDSQLHLYSGAGWSRVVTATLPPNYGYAAAFHAGRQRVVVFGGRNDETWELAGTGWTRIGLTPTGGSGGALAHDLSRGRTVFYGGRSTGGFTGPWVRDSDGWQEIAGVTGNTETHSMAYDALRARVVLFGGWNGQSLRGTTWELGDTWAQASPPVSPSPRQATGLAYDPARGRTVLFGGQTASGPDAETWEWDGASWRQISLAASPPARALHGLAYDPVRGAVIASGGRNALGQNLGDLWAYDGRSWLELAPGPGPGPRSDTPLAFDPRAGLGLLFGGTAAGTMGDSWELGPAGFTSSAAAPAPSARASHSLAYDPAAGAALLVGGWSNGPLLDVWRYVPARTPHARHAVHAALFSLDPAAVPSSLEVTYVGAGIGTIGGVPRAGVELHVFDFAAGAWSLVGSHAASEADPAAARTIAAALPAPVERFVRDGRLWLMAVSRDPSPVPPAPGESRVSTDLVEVRASFLLP